MNKTDEQKLPFFLKLIKLDTRIFIEALGNGVQDYLREGIR